MKNVEPLTTLKVKNIFKKLTGNKEQWRTVGPWVSMRWCGRKTRLSLHTLNSIVARDKSHADDLNEKTLKITSISLSGIANDC